MEEFKYRANNKYDLKPNTILKSLKFEICIVLFCCLGVYTIFNYLKYENREKLDKRFYVSNAKKFDLTDRLSLKENTYLDQIKLQREIDKEIEEYYKEEDN